MEPAIEHPGTAQSVVETTTGEPGSPRATGHLVQGDVVGRYVVLSRLGAGGMGVVYAAYDPELDRKVALKMLLTDPGRGTSPEARGRLLREAQALAKFSHPEIVAIHDVGEHAAGVWIAMELVDGRTLGAWAAEGRGWRDIVDVMLAVGRGVAAAHATGLVHRDLKPDNIMVGHDGRVRVMDFGLTRAASEAEAVDSDRSRHGNILASPLTRQGNLMGTPAYMAPEQFAGAEVTAGADQFAYCVTLWQLLYGERPFAGDTVMAIATAVQVGEVRAPGDPSRAPAWVRRICERGLARDPSRRWPSMQALLDELARGQSRIRRRNLAITGAGVVAIVTAAIGWQRFDAARALAACAAEGDAIASTWNDETRTRVREAVLATGVGHARTTADKVIPMLDAHAEAWREQRTQACVHAQIDHSWDAATLDRALWCLDERQAELAALADELALADAQVVTRAISAAARLDEPTSCLDETALARSPEPPSGELRAASAGVRHELVRAETSLAAGKVADALATVRTAAAQADALGWPPLVAATRQLEGAVLEKSGAYEEAEAASVDAYMDAAQAGAWGIAADAAIVLVFDVGFRLSRPAEGRVWARHAEVALGFAGDSLGLREAQRLEQLAIVHESASENDEADALHRRALAIREEMLGPEHPEVAASYTNLANVRYANRDLVQAADLYRRALAILEQALGPDHPDLASTLNNLGNVATLTHAHADAIPLYERSLALIEGSLGPQHPNVAPILNNLAYARRALGDNAQAEPLYRRALGILEAVHGAEHPDLATLLTNLGDVELGLARPAEALPMLERAVAMFVKQPGRQNNEWAAHFGLAKAIVATGGDRARAVAEATTARDGYRSDGGQTSEAVAVEIDAWLADPK